MQVIFLIAGAGAIISLCLMHYQKIGPTLLRLLGYSTLLMGITVAICITPVANAIPYFVPICFYLSMALGAAGMNIGGLIPMTMGPVENREKNRFVFFVWIFSMAFICASLFPIIWIVTASIFSNGGMVILVR
ncbi:MAG: hypothetical protein SFY67_01700 [Candidatus Melainabacteria bacterium]|nr:hypothetical protein [Candidatus Melainabacteria bacterium]